MSAKDEPDFATVLCRYRRRSGRTQEALAEPAGLSAASVSLLERGITLAPQKATVSMLCTALVLTSGETSTLLELSRESRRTDGDGSPRWLPEVASQTTLDGNLSCH